MTVDLTNLRLAPNAFQKSRLVWESVNWQLSTSPNDDDTDSGEQHYQETTNGGASNYDFGIEEILWRTIGGESHICLSQYGAAVLGTRRLVMLDIDLLPQVFGDISTLEIPNEFAHRLTNLKMPYLLYATYAGFRVLLFEPSESQHVREFDFPTSPDCNEFRSISDYLGVDPKYRDLCCQQGCYRARLTAKPWRRKECERGSVAVLRRVSELCVDCRSDEVLSFLVALHHYACQPILDNPQPYAVTLADIERSNLSHSSSPPTRFEHV